MEKIEVYKSENDDAATTTTIESNLSKGESPSLTLEDIDPKIEARLRRKFDARVLSSVTILYLWAFLTR